MEVKLLDLTRQYRHIKNEIDPVVQAIVNSQQFVNGPVVEEFEKNFAKFCDTKFAVGCSSGTDALLMSLIALNIGKGDEVITTPFTFFATVEAIIRVGATPVFVDINERTFNIDVSQIEKAITSKTKAILPVHLFGQCAEMDQILSLAKKYDLKVIEDACQAIGATWKGNKAGSMGTAGCFSFFPAKNLGAFGDGGAVTTNDEELYEKMRQTRQHGIDMSNVYHYKHVGGNFRLDALQAGVLNIKLRHIEKWQAQRNENAKKYNEMLSQTSVTTPTCHEECYHVYNQYVVRTSSRDNMKAKLQIENIGCAVYYPYPIHTQECISQYGYKEGDFPVTERACKEVLALPIYPDLKDTEQNFVADQIKLITKQILKGV